MPPLLLGGKPALPATGDAHSTSLCIAVETGVPWTSPIHPGTGPACRAIIRFRRGYVQRNRGALRLVRGILRTNRARLRTIRGACGRFGGIHGWFGASPAGGSTDAIAGVADDGSEDFAGERVEAWVVDRGRRLGVQKGRDLSGERLNG